MAHGRSREGTSQTSITTGHGKEIKLHIAAWRTIAKDRSLNGPWGTKRRGQKRKRRKKMQFDEKHFQKDNARNAVVKLTQE